jgi:hypothetical protein
MLCPPASFWQAAHNHLTHPDDLTNLAEAADNRRRDRWAYHFWHKAADTGNTKALVELAQLRKQSAAERLHQEIADVVWLAGRARQAADTGDNKALALIRIREEAGDRVGAERLLRQAADAGNTKILLLFLIRKQEQGMEGILWPYGLDPDGTPSAPWDLSNQPPACM